MPYVDPTKTIAERLRALETALPWSLNRRQLMPHLRSLMSAVDSSRLDAVRAFYAGRMRTANADSRYKYFDVAFYTLQKLLLAKELGLHEGRPRRILDIGTGGGHFPFVCRYFGHQVVGLDIENRVYDGIAACLGIERTIVRVEPRTALPALGERFDLIVACNITFDERINRDRTRARSYWSLAEWQFFLDDLMANQLRYPGRLYLSLNKQSRGRFLGLQRVAYDHELLAMAASIGASVSSWRGTINMSLSAPREILLPSAKRARLLVPWLSN
jgi:SAM-dependent methyltransferase